MYRKQKQILITGGAGYVGSLLVSELLAMGETVRVIDTLWFGFPFETHSRLQLIHADLGRCDSAWLDEVDAIIHLAGLSNDPTADFAPELNTASNFNATRQFVQFTGERSARDKREIRFIFASTCAV